jgi:hypothetical protein
VEPPLINPNDAHELLFSSLTAANAELTRVLARRPSKSRPTYSEQIARLKSINAILSRLEGLKCGLDELMVERETAFRKEFAELEARLREEVARRGWKFDGQWPSFYVARAIPLYIAETRKTVCISSQNLKEPSVAEILDVLAPHVASLLPKSFVPAQFLEQLSQAYDDVKSASAQKEIYDVYRELVIRSQPPKLWRDARTDYFTGLTVDQFRARLAETLVAQAITLNDGRMLRLLPPLNPKDGLFLFQPAESRFGFVGRLEFTRADA